MGLGFVFVLESDVEGVDPESMDGRALASERHALDAVAHEMDLPGIGEFVAFSHAEAETLAEDMKFDAPTTGGSTGRWFDCAKCLEVVRAIEGYLADEPDEVSDPEAVLHGLAQLRSLLESAEAAGTRFRLSIEY